MNLTNMDRMDLNIEQMNSQLRNLREREGFLQAQLAGIPRRIGWMSLKKSSPF